MRNNTTYPPGTTCVYEWCSRPVYARRLCKRDYFRWYRNKDLHDELPRIEFPAKGLKCAYCKEDAYAKGLCHSHYDKMNYRRLKPNKFDRIAEIREQYVG